MPWIFSAVEFKSVTRKKKKEVTCHFFNAESWIPHQTTGMWISPIKTGLICIKTAVKSDPTF